MKSIDEIKTAVRALGLTVGNLADVIGMAESFAIAMKREGGVSGVEDTCEHLLEAFMSCQNIQATTLEDRNELALARMIDERYGA